MRSWWTRLAVGTVLFLTQAVAGQNRDADPHATGALRPTEAQRGWADRHMATAGRVRPNDLALTRLNAERRRKGLNDLAGIEAAPLGSEALPADLTQAAATPEAAPAYVDNSTLPAFPPIRSQGSLSSCAQFSAIYYTLTHMTALARGWDAKGGGDAACFSPKWTYNVVNGGSNVGSWHYDAYAIAQKHGCATWAEFPYDADYRVWCLNPAVWRNAINVRAGQTGRVLSLDTGTGLAQLKQLLANGYVLNFATYVNSWQFKPIANDPATTADDAFVGRNASFWVNGTSGGHAMTVVGYSDDIWVDINGNGVVEPAEKGAFRIANSWGTGWQEGGFTWIAYDALKPVSAVPGGPSVGRQEGWWYREACWLTARPAYAPTMLARFTLNALKRNQVLATLGIGDTTVTTPASTWAPSLVLSYAGGPYAFDGTATACDGTFWLDFSDLAPAAATRWFVGLRDSAAGDPATVRSFQLFQATQAGDVLLGTAANAPKTADASQVYVWVDYRANSTNQPPVAVASASPTFGNVLLLADFDGSSSSDPDGFITNYAWNFGDGNTYSSASPTASHIFTAAGLFTVTLTVTDDKGATASTSLTITIADPTLLNAPSNLTAKAAGRNVTLTWTDNSANESGFQVECGVKVKAAIAFARVATLGSNATTFTQTLASGTYSYRVRAFNADRTSAYSNTVNVRVK